MHKIIVAGIGTGVGKTIVSAILTILFKGDYWKPIQCGDEESSDTSLMKKWLDPSNHCIYNPAYSLSSSLSPHHAAHLESISIKTENISPPQATRPLIIEGVGGVLVPLTTSTLTIDLFASWNCNWVIVSKHYLGSINHTLLTLEALKQRKISPLGLIFNGIFNPYSESVILNHSKLPLLGRLSQEQELNQETFQRYVRQWKPCFQKNLY